MSLVGNNNESKENVDQKYVINTILENLEKEFGGMFYLDAPGGTAVSFLWVFVI